MTHTATRPAESTWRLDPAHCRDGHLRSAHIFDVERYPWTVLRNPWADGEFAREGDRFEFVAGEAMDGVG